jgi:ribosome maturation factor RimP
MAMMRLHSLAASLLVLSSVDGFLSSPRPSFGTTLHAAKRAPSKVVDLDGPTKVFTPDDLEVITPEDIPEMHYDESAHPIPHQPWRRGETKGCEDPIDAEWRQMAEAIIYNAARSVGGQVRDVTWYLTQLTITLEEDFSGVDMYTTGPAVEVMSRRSGVQYFDPDDPNPEELWPEDEPMFMWEQDTEREERIRRGSYAPKDPDEEDDTDEDSYDDDDNPHVPIRVSKETRTDMAGYSDEEEVEIENEPVPVFDRQVTDLDTRAVSTIARAILSALEEAEEELNVLNRHAVVLSSPGSPDILDTQRQFDACRGCDVLVETVDPWQSNRVLRGKLLERNSMDILINKKGRMVTIPLNFVKAVRLVPTKKDDRYK